MTQNNISNDIYKDICMFNNSVDNFTDLSYNIVSKSYYAKRIFIWIISIIEIPIMLLTLYALCFLMKSRHSASVYVIHLILSDLVQIICMTLCSVSQTYMFWAYKYSLFVGVFFMPCIAFERYLLVSHPVWYRTHHSFKLSGFISLIIWFMPLTFLTIKPSYVEFKTQNLAVAYLIPYLIIIFCFVGTWRGLSRSISITSHKRRLILGSLFLVLLTYTFLIFPQSIKYFILPFSSDYDSFKVYMFLKCLLYLNPLADCLLYLFMRTDAGDIMKSLYHCCKSDPVQISVQYKARTSTQPHDV